ncbi:20306_t:CDS:2 [Entrophospora sp. SA101]|nr:20306_t:CDS:2 [Entrophospora sp. SA101]
MSMSSAERKCNEEGDGHKLDFMISVDINGDADKFETLYGLFKRFCQENHVFLILEYGAMEKFINILESVPDLPKSMCQGFVIPPITVAHALIYLHHKKIIRRDIKPENLLLGLNNDLKIADFGWSVHTPEMVDSLIHGSRADLWNLGVLCYELLFGTVPFSGPGGCKGTHKRIVRVEYSMHDHISEDAKHFIKLKKIATSKNPDQRLSLEE